MNEPEPDPYHHIRHTTMFVEQIMCVPGDGLPTGIWGDMMSLGLPPDKVVVGCKMLGDIQAEDPKVEQYRKTTRAEMDRPEFLTYIAGKMGAV